MSKPRLRDPGVTQDQKTLRVRLRSQGGRQLQQGAPQAEGAPEIGLQLNQQRAAPPVRTIGELVGSANGEDLPDMERALEVAQ